MAKWQNDNILDAALNYIKDNTISVVLCNAQPATYAEASTTIGNGGHAMATASVAANDMLIDDGSFSGRKITIPQCTDVTVDETDSATHVALISDTELIYVTTCISQSLTAGNLVTIPAWEIELRDAV